MSSEIKKNIPFNKKEIIRWEIKKENYSGENKICQQKYYIPNNLEV